jgi:hypothetical protein
LREDGSWVVNINDIEFRIGSSGDVVLHAPGVGAVPATVSIKSDGAWDLEIRDTHIEADSKGNVTVNAKGDIHAYTNGNVIRNHFPLPEVNVRQRYRPGQFLPDGTIYAYQKQNGQHVATLPRMISRRATHQTAWSLIKGLDAHGHTDWDMPDTKEGHALYIERASGELQHTFALSEFGGERPAFFVRAVHDNSRGVLAQFFDDGHYHSHRGLTSREFRGPLDLSVCAVRRFTL